MTIRRGDQYRVPLGGVYAPFVWDIDGDVVTLRFYGHLSSEKELPVDHHVTVSQLQTMTLLERNHLGTVIYREAN